MFVITGIIAIMRGPVWGKVSFCWALYKHYKQSNNSSSLEKIKEIYHSDSIRRESETYLTLHHKPHYRENASNLESRSSTANWKPSILLLFYSSPLNKAIVTDLIKRVLYFFTEGFKMSTGWLVNTMESGENICTKCKKDLPEDNWIHLYSCSCITVAWKTENFRNDDFLSGSCNYSRR